MGVTGGVGVNSTMPRTMLSPPLTGEKNAQQSKRARVDFDVGAYAAAMKLVKAGQCDCQLIYHQLIHSLTPCTRPFAQPLTSLSRAASDSSGLRCCAAICMSSLFERRGLQSTAKSSSLTSFAESRYLVSLWAPHQLATRTLHANMSLTCMRS
jgi:hypothetical protein